MIDSSGREVSFSVNLHCESESFIIKIDGENSNLATRIYCKNNQSRISPVVKFLANNAPLASSLFRLFLFADIEMICYFEEKRIARVGRGARVPWFMKPFKIKNIEPDFGALFQQLVNQRRNEQRSRIK